MGAKLGQSQRCALQPHLFPARTAFAAMANPTVVGAPGQQQMVYAGRGIDAVFGPKDSLLVKQTMRGCLQECLGCEAKSEFKISGMDWQYLDGGWLKEGATSLPDEMYAIEQSSFLVRCCWRDGRPFNMKVSEGAGPGGPPLVEYRKPCGMPLYCDLKDVRVPCCCCLPEVTAFTPDGRELNNSKYLCFESICVPHFAYSEGGKRVYTLRPPTCCCGMCIECTCGKNGCQVPFFFYDPASGDKIVSKTGSLDPQIRKVWAGMKKECCSTADTFVVFFPPDISPERKAGILGLTFLLDFTVFERQQESSE